MGLYYPVTGSVAHAEEAPESSFIEDPEKIKKRKKKLIEFQKVSLNKCVDSNKQNIAKTWF